MQLVSRRVIRVLSQIRVIFFPHAKLGEPVIPKRMSHQRCVAYAVGVGLGRLECGLF
jgi:hypothetical protein